MTPPEYAELDAAAMAEVAQQGYCTPFQKQVFRKDGSRVPILIGVAAVHGTAPPWICSVADLTVHKAAEQDRVAFIDAATHDLKNPLTFPRAAHSSCCDEHNGSRRSRRRASHRAWWQSTLTSIA
jgi:hypothetical protein